MDSINLTESLVGAAIEWRGKIYTGYSHDDALDNARNAIRAGSIDNLMPFLDASIAGSIPKGFLTTENRFVNRNKAFLIAKQSKQLKEEYADANTLQSFMISHWE